MRRVLPGIRRRQSCRRIGVDDGALEGHERALVTVASEGPHRSYPNPRFWTLVEPFQGGQNGVQTDRCQVVGEHLERISCVTLSALRSERDEPAQDRGTPRG